MTQIDTITRRDGIVHEADPSRPFGHGTVLGRIKTRNVGYYDAYMDDGTPVASGASTIPDAIEAIRVVVQARRNAVRETSEHVARSAKVLDDEALREMGRSIGRRPA